jgi:hypothetical protein
MIYNDLAKGGPTWSESTISTLTAIKHNKNIKDDFESLMKNPSTRQSSRKGNGPFRFWIPTDFDPGLLGNLITTTAQTSKGIFYSSLYIEAHDWLTDKYLQIQDKDIKQSAKVKEDFWKVKKFKPLYESMSQITWKSWLGRFYNGKVPTIMAHKEVKKAINDNLLEYRLHKIKQEEFFNNKIVEIVSYINDCISRQLGTSGNQSSWDKEYVMSKFGFKTDDSFHSFYYKNQLDKKLVKDQKIFKNNAKKVYSILFEVAKINNIVTCNEWAELAHKQFDSHNLDTSKITPYFISVKFIKKDTFNVLTKLEWAKFDSIKQKIIKSRRSEIPTLAWKDKGKRKNYLLSRKGNKTPKKYFVTPDGLFVGVNAVKKHFSFSGDTLRYKRRTQPKEWYEISLQQYEKLSKSKA